MCRAARNIASWILILLNITLMAQESHVLDLDFSMDGFRMTETKEGNLRIEALDDAFYYGEGKDHPALPLRTIRFLVPNGAEILDYEYSSDLVLIREHISLEALPTPLPLSDAKGASRSSLAPGPFEGSFPEQVIHYSGTGIQRGYTWFSFQISPFLYDGARKTLSMVSHLELEVKYQLNQEHQSMHRPTEELLRHLEGSMENPEDLTVFYPLEEANLLKSSGREVDYLVLTTEALKPEFEALIEWKIRKGLKAEIITLEKIYTSYEGASDPLKIKYCLFDYYSNMNLKWAFLAGDHDVVPVQGCYSEVNVGTFAIEDWSVPTDLFYACFDKRFDWNSNADDKIGQAFRDGQDLLPEIYISRIPVRNQQQAREFVRKTLRYEQNPPRENFAELMLLSGIESWNTWNGKSDNHHRSELLFSSYVEENWQGEMKAFFDTGTDFISNQDYQVTVSNMTEQLNSGYGFFHFSGHANTEAFAMEEGPAFSTVHATDLSNSDAGIILSTSCDVNAYDSIDPCLSESFLRNPDGGCVAFFGSTRYGFGYPDTLLLLGPSYQYSASFLKYIFGETAGISAITLGEVASRAKSDYVYSTSAGGVFFFLLYAVNVMGDPELPILTTDPSTFDNVRLYRMGNSLSVNTGGMKDCRISLTSQDLSEAYQEVLEGESFHTFEDIPEHFELCITARNYVPYRYFSGSFTGVNEGPDPHIRLYPNPFSDHIQIEMDLSPGLVQVYDVHGRMVLEREIFSSSASLDLSDHPEGMYMFKVRSEGKSSWFKLMKL